MSPSGCAESDVVLLLESIKIPPLLATTVVLVANSTCWPGTGVQVVVVRLLLAESCAGVQALEATTVGGVLA